MRRAKLPANQDPIGAHVRPEMSYRSEGFALTGYVVPGWVEDGTWMLLENSAVAATVLAQSWGDSYP